MNVSVSQAMACGLPVITTRHSGLPEQVVHGVTGLVVPEGDWRALADALMQLIEHPELWAEKGRAGRARVKQMYDNSSLIGEQIAIYEKLIR